MPFGSPFLPLSAKDLLHWWCVNHATACLLMAAGGKNRPFRFLQLFGCAFILLIKPVVVSVDAGAAVLGGHSCH
jgi:hypothetical protein